jgi:SpoVK/Ycf46/Vps4 family AAA+-type ATPase
MKERKTMGRAERRRTQKLEQKEKTTTYNLTKAQLDAMVRKKIGDELTRVKQEATDDAVNTAMVLLLTLPLEVLMDHYWTKSYAKRIPKFTERVLEYYERWQNGELDMEKLKEDLWEYGGVKLVESEGEAT